MNLFHLLAIASVCGYVCAAVLQLGVLRVRNRNTTLSRVHDIFFLAATFACIFVELKLVIDHGSHGLTGFLLAAVLGVGSLYLYLRKNFPLVLVLVAPLNVLILLVQIYFLPHLALSQGHHPGFITTIHVYMAILGQAFAALAAMVALVYLVLHYALKRRNLRALQFEIPPLDMTQRILSTLLWSGFGFLTLSLITGAWITIGNSTATSDSSMQIKVIWALAVWTWYLATIMAKNIFQAPWLVVSKMNLLGFLLMASTFFGVLVMRLP